LCYAFIFIDDIIDLQQWMNGAIWDDGLSLWDQATDGYIFDDLNARKSGWGDFWFWECFKPIEDDEYKNKMVGRRVRELDGLLYQFFAEITNEYLGDKHFFWIDMVNGVGEVD